MDLVIVFYFIYCILFLLILVGWVLVVWLFPTEFPVGMDKSILIFTL